MTSCRFQADQEVLAAEFMNWWVREFFHGRAWSKMKFLGVPIAKHPFDLQVFQEILTDVQPDVIVETGTFCGGAALYYHVILAALGKEHRIISVDLEQNVSGEADWGTFLSGSSTDVAILDQIRALIKPTDKVMVFLDSDHHTPHVRAEMDLYAPLVTLGSYLIVEDGDINGHPVDDGFGPGPYEAIMDFLPLHPEFERDMEREKKFSGITQNTAGYLRRVR